MASRTEHYGLSLPRGWEGLNAAEVRADHSALDAAIYAAQVRAEGATAKTADLEYNVYNLVLQDYYDGKQTGYKKALLFDGFRDGNGIASLGGGIQRGNGILTLQKNGQGNISIGYGSRQGESATTPTQTTTGSGRITGFQCQLYCGMAVQSESRVTYSLALNGAVATTGQWATPVFAPGTTQTVTVAFPRTVEVKAGDTVALTLTSGGSAWLLTLAANNAALAGTFIITSVTGDAGRMTGKTNSLPACSGLRAWVRYQGGAVSIAMRDKSNNVHTLKADGTRSTINLQGSACTEAAFKLEEGLSAGNGAVLLDLTLGGSAAMTVFDYGVVLL